MTVAASFRIEKLRDSYFVPILVDEHGVEFFRSNVCVCADQATSCATRGGTRPLRFDGMFQTRGGIRETIDDRSCDLGPRSPVWPHHGWTHGLLSRMEAPMVTG